MIPIRLLYPHIFFVFDARLHELFMIIFEFLQIASAHQIEYRTFLQRNRLFARPLRIWLALL